MGACSGRGSGPTAPADPSGPSGAGPATGSAGVAATAPNVHHDPQLEKGAAMAVENDLAELKGIGPKYAAMLKEIGVDSIKELRHRNPAKLKEMIESRHGAVIGL